MTQKWSIAAIIARLSDSQMTTRDAKKEIANILHNKGFSTSTIKWLLSRRDILNVKPPLNQWTQRYILTAAKRLDAHMTTPQQEQRFYRLHRRANQGRTRSAKNLSRSLTSYGPLLGWYARHDSRTTPECRYRGGKNFYIDHPPQGELPGIGTHYGCRCRAGKPHKNASIMSK